MILDSISIALIVPLTSAIIDIDTFKDQNFINNYIFQVFEYLNLKNLTLFCLLSFITFYSLRITFNLLLVVLHSKFSFSTYEYLSKKVFKSYLKKEWNYFSDKNTAEIFRDIIGETGLFRSSVILPFLVLISEFFIFFGIFVLLIFFDTSNTFFLILLFIVIAFFYRLFFKKKINLLADKRQSYSTHVNKNVIETFKLFKEIKLSFKEIFFYKNFKINNKNYISSNYVYTILSSIPRYLLEIIIILLIGILIFDNLVNDKNLIEALPTLSIFLAASYRVIPSIVKILRSFQSLDWGVKSTEVLYKILMEEKVETKLSDRKDIQKLEFKDQIKLNSINFKYKKNQNEIIKNLDLEIKKFETVGIIGKSGSGKTTLVNLITGLLNPTQGSILVDEKNINENIKGWQKNIFVVQQDNYVLDDTIKKNITLEFDDLLIDNKKYLNSLEKASLKDFIDKLELKDQTIVGEDGIKISGGQKQRLSIARALYHDPDVLILDEATSSLDLQTENEILNFLSIIKGQKTIFIISHRESSLKLCDKIIRL